RPETTPPASHRLPTPIAYVQTRWNRRRARVLLISAGLPLRISRWYGGAPRSELTVESEVGSTALSFTRPRRKPRVSHPPPWISTRQRYRFDRNPVWLGRSAARSRGSGLHRPAGLLRYRTGGYPR